MLVGTCKPQKQQLNNAQVARQADTRGEERVENVRSEIYNRRGIR